MTRAPDRGQAWENEYQKRERGRANSTGAKACCTKCHRKGGVENRFRLSDRTYAIVEWRLLCLKCGQRGGWHSPRMTGRNVV
jgi:hypothetical protein